MNVTVLVENTSYGDIAGEHGLCLLVEHYGKKYLIDTGASKLFAENASKLGIDLAQVDVAFLSHAHYDHSGGYDVFFEKNSKATLYMQGTCRNKYYYKVAGPVKKYIGIPKGMVETFSDRIEYVNGYMELGDGVYICPHTTKGLELRGKHAHMYRVDESGMVPDDFSHEQTIVFQEGEYLYIFNSCSHGGVDNIIDEVKQKFPNKRIVSFFGGFHMMGSLGVDTCAYSEDEVKAVARTIKESSLATFYTGHCTGHVALAWLKDVLGDRVVSIHSGMIINN
ncbi:MAG: MBL fold metallo-hydrolase [Pseudobutyrivibrio sp.]|nr:MBL fold metallo-hydrolase [Pseudobutyrivibrio sp.]